MDDWSPHGAHAKLLHWHFLQTYMDRDGHKHVHGANMGVSAEAYRRAGGFKSLACSEDHALIHALEAAGLESPGAQNRAYRQASAVMAALKGVLRMR